MINQTQAKSTFMNKIDGSIVAFFVLAYAIAWGAFGIIAIIANQSGLENAQLLMGMGETWQYGDVTVTAPRWVIYLLTRLADFAFSISGIILIFITQGRDGLKQLWQRLIHWRIHPLWYVAGLLPLALFGLSVVMSGEASSPQLSSSTISTMLFSLQSGFLVSLFLRGAFGEEFGLRGFALPQLQKSMSPFWASVVIGVLWGLWHLPVLIGRDVISIIVFILLALCLSFLFTWMFNGSGGSLIPVLLFHATQNWEEGFEVLFPSLAGTDWELTSTVLLLLAGIVTGIVVWRDSKRANPEDAPSNSEI